MTFSITTLGIMTLSTTSFNDVVIPNVVAYSQKEPMF
jgi:hypothetical protein